MPKNDLNTENNEEKKHASYVKGVFDNVADKYDIMNDVMSLGLQRYWKDKLIQMVGNNFSGPLDYIDLAGGTGDVALKFKRKFPEANIHIIDKNIEMIKAGISKNPNKSNINYLCSSGEDMAIKDNFADVLTLSFGIRNMSNRKKCLEECLRVLKPSGLFLCMEFSMPENYTLRNIYDAWSYGIIPNLGKLIVGSSEPYEYLVNSIRSFPNPNEFSKILRSVGFKKLSIRQLSGNIVCVYRANKN